MKLIDNLMNILAALALTFAVLATIPAAAYGAVTYHGNMHEGFVIDNTVSQEAANMEAERICEITAPATNTCDMAITELENECIAFGSVMSGQIFIREGDTIAEADTKIGLLSGFGVTNDNRSVCDHTCTDGQSPNADDVAGCHTTTADDCSGATPMFDDSGPHPVCRAAMLNCSGATPILDETGTNPVCRAAMEQSECLMFPLMRFYDDTGMSAATGNCREPRSTLDCLDSAGTGDDIYFNRDVPSKCWAGMPCLGSDATGDADGIPHEGRCISCIPQKDLGTTCSAPCGPGEVTLPLPEGGCRDRTQADCDLTPAEPILGDGNRCRARIQSDCDGTALPILDGNSCRATEQRDCDGTAMPILDGNSCRAVEQSDCDGTAMPILAGGSCRDRIQSDCTGNTPILEESTTPNSCRDRIQADCTGATPIFDDSTTPNSCRVREQSDCDGTAMPILAGGSCRDRIQSDCTGNTPILEESTTPNSCRDRIQADCTGATPIFDDSTTPNSCRVREQSDCDGTAMPILAGGSCRDRIQSDCTGNTPILEESTTPNSCREMRAGDCPPAMPLLDGSNCRARNPSDCTGATPILDGGSCRARNPSDCTGATPILDGDNCRARNEDDCTGATPILDGGNCRARIQADCDGTAMPILDGGSCRERIQSDCDGTAMPILEDGSCRARMDGDCPVDMPILDGDNCRARIQADCDGTAMPILDGGSCRARIQSDCTGATPILADGECQARMDDGDGETPEFVFELDELDEENGSGETTTDRYVVAATAITNLEIAIATTLGGITYTSEENSSEQLRVSPSSGVVSFINPDSVAAGDYQIFIAATQGGRIIATLSLYFTVAAADDAVATTSGGGNNDLQAATAGAAGAAVFIASYFIAHYVGVLIDWTPSYAFRNHNGDFYYAVGSRWTAAADNWRWYWQANQSGGNRGGQFGYGSGMSYHGDVFAAAFNSQSDTKQTAMDLSLSANKTAGVWHFGGGYRFNVELTETETETKNRLNLTARYTLDKWILSATANTDGNKAAARINYSYRF